MNSCEFLECCPCQFNKSERCLSSQILWLSRYRIKLHVKLWWAHKNWARLLEIVSVSLWAWACGKQQRERDKTTFTFEVHFCTALKNILRRLAVHQKFFARRLSGHLWSIESIPKWEPPAFSGIITFFRISTGESVIPLKVSVLTTHEVLGDFTFWKIKRGSTTPTLALVVVAPRRRQKIRKR